MANKKISALTAAGALTGAELVELVQGGANVRSTTQDIADLSGAGGGVQSVTGDGVDNTDPDNPVIDLSSYYTSTEADTAISNAINEVITYVFNDKTDDYTLVLTDFETPTFLRVTKTGTATITVPPNSSVAVAVGRALIVKKVGTGDLTFSPGSGVTIVPSSGSYTSAPNQQVVLLKEGTNTWGLYNGIAVDAGSLGLVPDSRQVAGNALTADISITTLLASLGVKSKKVLASDVTNDNATPDTLADVTGLSFAVLANTKYYFRFFITYTAAAGTTGSRWSINGPALTYTNFNSHFASNGTTQLTKEGLTAYDTGGSVSTTSASLTGNIAIIEGVIECSAGGTVIARFSSEVASSAIVAKAGFSFVEWMVITDKP